jgi:hypothetical protein
MTYATKCEGNAEQTYWPFQSPLLLTHSVRLFSFVHLLRLWSVRMGWRVGGGGWDVHRLFEGGVLF